MVGHLQPLAGSERVLVKQRKELLEGPIFCILYMFTYFQKLIIFLHRNVVLHSGTWM